jgi:hypothetical protein
MSVEEPKLEQYDLKSLIDYYSNYACDGCYIGTGYVFNEDDPEGPPVFMLEVFIELEKFSKICDNIEKFIETLSADDCKKVYSDEAGCLIFRFLD